MDRLDVASIADAVNGSPSPRAAWRGFMQALRRHGVTRAAMRTGMDPGLDNPFARGAGIRQLGNLWDADLEERISGFRGRLRRSRRPELLGLRPTMLYLAVSSAPLVVEHREVMRSPVHSSVAEVSRSMFEDFGMYQSVILPLNDPRRGRVGFLALWGDEDRPDFRRFANANLPALHMAAHFLSAALDGRFPATKAKGVPLLSDRERQVLDLHGRGLQTDAVADHLGISERSVREYVLRARQKLGVASREAAIARAATAGLIG